MHCNILRCFIKQNCHLSLCQPHSLVLQTDINLCLSVIGLIYHYFVLLHKFRFIFSQSYE